MLRKVITYTDYNGVEKKGEYYFNLTQHEITKMQMGVKGGLIESLKAAIKTEDSNTIMTAFEDLIDKSYGIKTPDGKFIKKPEYLDDFKSTPAYSKLFMEILTDPKASDEFTRGVSPSDVKLPDNLDDSIPEDIKEFLPSTQN